MHISSTLQASELSRHLASSMFEKWVIQLLDMGTWGERETKIIFFFIFYNCHFYFHSQGECHARVPHHGILWPWDSPSPRHRVPELEKQRTQSIILKARGSPSADLQGELSPQLRCAKEARAVSTLIPQPSSVQTPCFLSWALLVHSV